MILLFLGSWRSTVIVAISIPLSILTSIIILKAFRADLEHHDAGRTWDWRSASWWTMPRWRLRTSIETWVTGQGDRTRHSGWSLADRGAGVCFDAVRFALCSCRWCFFPARRRACLRRWRWRWCLRCWRRTCCPDAGADDGEVSAGSGSGDVPGKLDERA